MNTLEVIYREKLENFLYLQFRAIIMKKNTHRLSYLHPLPSLTQSTSASVCKPEFWCSSVQVLQASAVL